MKKLLLAVAVLAPLALVVACGGDDDDGDDGGTTPAATTRTRTVGTALSGSAGTQTAVADRTAVAGQTPTSDQLTAVGTSVSGGAPDSTPQVVNTLPPPPPGKTPQIDPTEIAEPDAPGGATKAYIDMDASEPGIQATREVTAGDQFKVAVVFANVPPKQGDLGGLAAFNWEVNYDKTKIVAPTISGGDIKARNPDLNLPDVGGEAAGWDCLPAPEGDLDDPGGIDGDGQPNTGQAFLSCFTAGTGDASGTLVTGVITFQAVASGTVTLELVNISAGDAVGIEIMSCDTIECVGATVTVRD